MNINDNPEELRKEEQSVLDALIYKMDQVVLSLDKRMQEYVAEAKNADISINPDLYLSRILALRGIKDTAENREKILQARDELYHTRLLLQYDDAEGKGIDEIKVGLHSCMHEGKHFVVEWTMPLCRHYLLDNSSAEYESVAKNKYGEEYHTNYKLLVKNEVKLRFTHVVKAMNMYPGIFDDSAMKMIKGSGFFSDTFLDEMIRKFNPDDYDPQNAADIISDEFLRELLERRSTPEFRNIVFSIQKKQGEIIQAPYNRNMIVQGCAGSGKSMIMLHRLPILLYDNPTSLSRTNLYVITPSQMYIQLAENMRYQLEISDINMGTIEQYYDYCISKYPGHKAGEYGKISYSSRISSENEKYIYSAKLVSDIKEFLETLIIGTDISLVSARELLGLKEPERKQAHSYAQRISNSLSEIQNVLSANNQVVISYYKAIMDSRDALQGLAAVLRHRKDSILREIAKRTAELEDDIRQAQKELEKLDEKENSIAIRNRNITIDTARKRIIELEDEKNSINEDQTYFDSLSVLSLKIEEIIKQFENVKNEFSQNTVNDIYDAIDNRISFAADYFDLAEEIEEIVDKYEYYVGSISKDMDKAAKCISVLSRKNDRFIAMVYYREIRRVKDVLTNVNTGGVKAAYEHVMKKIGVRKNKNGNIRALKCSPYIYLQTLYMFQGVPNNSKESLLAIDEAQGFAPEEIRLLKNVNGPDVVFNLYGDIHQHIEGTKGVDNWNEYSDVLKFDVYEMQENYRNASQITDYCNKAFGMKMNAINTPGKGVHEMLTEEDFRDEMITQLMDDQRVGLAAILVGSNAEAQYLMGEFASFSQKLHDMTEEDFGLHRTRWNIILIDDAKGIEFSSVIVLAGRMSRNQRYIAYTRALDDLYVYKREIDVKGYEKKTKNNMHNIVEEKPDNSKKNQEEIINDKRPSKHAVGDKDRNHNNSLLRDFFEEHGLEVIDKRDSGGRLWVIGAKNAIQVIVNEATSKFNISGKFMSSKEINNRPGWCTKSEK